MKKSSHRKRARGTWLLVSTSTKNLLQICIPLKWKLNRQERPLPIVSVIHLELDKEVELFECYECISLHQEVLLISVHRAYLWWTENAKSWKDGVCVKTFLSLNKLPHEPNLFSAIITGCSSYLPMMWCLSFAEMLLGQEISHPSAVSDLERTAIKDDLAGDRKYAACLSLLEKKDADSQKVWSRSDETIWDFHSSRKAKVRRICQFG